MKMIRNGFSKTVLVSCALGLLISAVPLAGAFASDITFINAKVLLKVKPQAKVDRDWFEASFCLESATPFEIGDLFDAKRVVLRMPDLDAVLSGGTPPFALTRVFRQNIAPDTPTIAEDDLDKQQKYRFTSRDQGAIWDLQLDPTPNTNCYPGIWGYIWVNEENFYGDLRAAETPKQYRYCIRGESGNLDCGNGLDAVQMVFKLGEQTWKGQVKLEPQRNTFDNSKLNEKFIIAD